MKKILYLAFLICMPALAQTYPYTDPFTGTGALGANYACGSNASITLSKSSGTVTASSGGSSDYADCAVTSQTFTFFTLNNMYASLKDPVGSPNAGPALLDGSNNGYAWVLGTKQIQKITAGFPTGLSGFVCPFTAVNDIAAITKQGNTISCVDVTANGGSLICSGGSACGSVTDSSVTPTHPGIISLAGASIAGPLTADCFPATCGVLPSPTPSATPSGSSPSQNWPSSGTGPFYGPGGLASVTPTLPGSSIGCYRTDGIAPTVSAHGTCGAGSTTYTSGAITLTQPPPTVINTIKIMATSSTFAADSAVVTWIFAIESLQNIPDQQGMGWPVLANAQVTLNSYLNFCTLCTVTASITGNFGGATGTLDSTAAGNSIRTLTVGPTAGVCTVGPVYPSITGTTSGGAVTSTTLISGGSGLPPSSVIPIQIAAGGTASLTMTTNSSGVVVSVAIVSGGTGFATGTTNPFQTNYPFLTKITSTAGFNVKFTSVDDPTQIATFPINVCANSTDVETFPFYETRYAGQPLEIQAMTTGTASPQVTWSITSQPSGGDGALDASPLTACEIGHSCYTTVFSATVAGRYSVQACNAIETSACRTTTVFVTGNAQPRNVSPNGTEVIDPTVDPFCPANGGTVYEVGPSQTHTTINSIDFRTLVGCDTVRVHNEGPNGTPTSYPEAVVFTGNGTPTKPIRFVGVPNAGGELPVLEGSNSTAPSWADSSTYSAMVNSWATPCPPGGYGVRDAGSCGPNWVVVEGFRIQDVRSLFNTTYPFFGYLPWNNGSADVALHSGYGWVLRGLDLYNSSQCIGTYTPNTKGWTAVTQMVDIEGNNCHQFGDIANEQDHGMYLQSFGEVIRHNWIHDPLALMKGSGIKTRSFQFTIAENYIDNSTGLMERFLDHVDVQDAAGWFGLDNYNCLNGDCTTAFPVSGFTTNYIGSASQPLTPTLAAGIFAASRNQWDVGNIFNGTGTSNTVHYAGDEFITATIMRGTLHLLYNTSIGTRFFLDVMGGGVSTLNQYEYPSFDIQNNIIDSPTGTGSFAVAGSMTPLGAFGKNLFRITTIDPTVSITGCIPSANCGWVNSVPFSSTALSWYQYSPVNSHMSGINATEFVFTPTNASPVNSSTFVPITGGGAISAGAALTGDAANFPIRMPFVPSLGYPVARTRLLDLGALDSTGSLPTPVSNAVTPNPGATTVGATVTMTCTTTYSDSSTLPCISPVWSVLSGSAATINSSTGVVTGLSIGSVTVQAVASSLTSPAVTVNVGAVAIAIQFTGSVKMSGNIH